MGNIQPMSRTLVVRPLATLHSTGAAFSCAEVGMVLKGVQVLQIIVMLTIYVLSKFWPRSGRSCCWLSQVQQ